jgi:hypothetical protein
MMARMRVVGGGGGGGVACDRSDSTFAMVICVLLNLYVMYYCAVICIAYMIVFAVCIVLATRVGSFN